MNTTCCRITQLPKIADARGNLSIIEQFKHVPFEIRRVHWIYDVPGGVDRGGHAYRMTEEYIVALSGSFDVEIDDGEKKHTYALNRSYYGLYVPKGMWRTMTNFSTNSLALVLSSTDYDEQDYIMGVQANLWTEQVAYPEHAFYQLLPRLASMSEVQWCQPARKDFEGFKTRLPWLKKLYDKLGYVYCNEVE